MRNIFKYGVVVVLLLCMKSTAFATHIVGGEMFYDHLGGGSYRVTLKIYRDCKRGTAPFDGNFNDEGKKTPPALLHVFDASGNLVRQVPMGIPVVTQIPPSINNPCIQTPNDVCVEEGKYEITINLPSLIGGYTLVYQRCCRNNTILNLTNPGNQGASYQAFIPGPEVVLNNSSPRFDNFPPIFVCNGLDVKFNHKATDLDGDELVYSICSSYNGLDACCAIITVPAMAPAGAGPSCPNPPPFCPSVTAAPPYPFTNYVAPYNASYPMASSPSLAIHPTTGLLTGIPTINGQWVVSICVEEFRNGQLLSKHYRDFQFNVKPCIVNVVSAVANQTSKCQGDTIQFSNQSVGATENHWDFGVIGILSDTSKLTNPFYIYPDTGTYIVTLIINSGKPCTDTIKKTFFVYPRLDVNFAPQNLQCLKNNSFNFNAGGTFVSLTTFKWDFGETAIPNTSTLKSPSNVNFTSAGTYFVKLVAKQLVCIDSFIDSVRIMPRPIAKINNFPTLVCDPGKVSFSNGSVTDIPAGYIWQTSDSAVYTSYEPSHIFSPPGVYGVTLTLIRGAPCPDTSKASIQTFTVFPTPKADFVFSPSITTIFDPEIYFENAASSDVSKWLYEFGDGGTSTFMNETHYYILPGKYGVIQTVKNRFDCSDKIEKVITILPEFRFWIPNAFTPDENNLNDIFRPVTIGVSNYSFTIFDRWGHVIFESDDLSKGWDGKFKGKPCKQDVYVWRIRYSNDVTQKYELKTGHVTLLNNQFEY